MDLIFALKMLCDICFYLAFGSVAAGYFGGGGVAAAAPLFAAAAWVCAALRRKGRSPFPALVLLPVCLLPAWGSGVNLVLLLPAAGYLVFCVSRIDRYLGRISYAATFSLFLKAYAPFAVVFTIIGAGRIVEERSLPFAVLFLAGAVSLLRLARHDPDISGEGRFQMVNALPVAAVLLGGFALSSRTVLGLFGNALRFLYFQLIAPLLLLLANIMAYLLMPLFSLIDFSQRAQESQETPGEAGAGALEQFGEPGEMWVLMGQVLRALVIIAAAAGVIYIVIRLFRRLADSQAREAEAAGIVQTRMSLDRKPGEKRGAETRRHPVRKAYRKFLLACRSAGMGIEAHQTSRDVERSAAALLGRENVPGEIRQIYLPVRYGGAEAGKESVRRMKAACGTAEKAARK